MSLKHLFAGIMGVGVVMLLGVDPSTVAPEAAAPGFVQADKVIAKAATEAEQKRPDRAAADCDRDKVRVADCGKEIEQADKPAALEQSWTHRLVFPAGNKF